MIRRRTVGILHGHRSALALGLPWYVDIVAVVVGEVEHRSRMARVKDSLGHNIRGYEGYRIIKSYVLGGSTQLEGGERGFL